MRLIQVGPGAHRRATRSCTCPDARLLYAGDILFVGGTPIVVGRARSTRWIAALRPDPRHGRRHDRPGPRPGGGQEPRSATCASTSCSCRSEARKRFEDGLTVDAAIASIDLGKWAELPEHGRLAQNVINVYQQLDPTHAAAGAA